MLPRPPHTLDILIFKKTISEPMSAKPTSIAVKNPVVISFLYCCRQFNNQAPDTLKN
ncbi:MAG: hypothetical protein LCH67_01520 [Bacteroidetes bacterium]|nr:hypothetical protein [Bacteroidota bacterium]